MKITLKAKSSSGEPYDVDFLFEKGSLLVHCTCKAGMMRTVCKHRIAFLKGDKNMLANSSQAEQLAQIKLYAEASDFPALLQQLDTAEAEVSRFQREVKKLKKRIEEGMTHGLSHESRILENAL